MAVCKSSDFLEEKIVEHKIKWLCFLMYADILIVNHEIKI